MDYLPGLPLPVPAPTPTPWLPPVLPPAGVPPLVGSTLLPMPPVVPPLLIPEEDAPEEDEPEAPLLGIEELLELLGLTLGEDMVEPELEVP
ncbi:MAG TPA: hypothetical protein VIM12_01320 [Noviherbaspirillum sp.]|uniref:hypothetical protein n=1 Tax=Noviherbaspirillum sp. TaxID=1926288 RepID=UPI002F93A668